MQYIIISDFDGTIINCDMASKILEYIEGEEIVENLWTALANQEISINEFMNFVCYALELETEGCKTSMPIDIIHNVIKKNDINIDQCIYTLIQLCKKKNYPFYILSGGFKKVITDMLKITPDIVISHDFDIVDNHVKFACNQNIVPKGKFIEEHVLKYGRKIIFIGDGYSDFSVIKYCDLLFTKCNSVLEIKCISGNIEHFSFDNFNDIVQKLSQLKIF
jgi:HAD superfamily phosphoserine phosphatase-like hydrolase